MHKVDVIHFLRKAPAEHKISTAVVLVALWYVTETVWRYHMAAHAIELFGVAPAAERVMVLLFGE
ncbi:hypothetical protein [Paraburkholderia unamae]|uniref:Uncharacterized protein n=1 Tax=Paraburkholderia unamae TaxID=219649 RepID=A0ACC6RGP1_9BURK